MKMVYLITYDLNRPGQDYQALWEALSVYDHMRDMELDSVWFVVSSETAATINARLMQHIDGTDRLFVTKLRLDEYEGFMNKELWLWLKARL